MSRKTKRWGLGAKSAAKRFFARAKQILTEEPGATDLDAGDAAAAEQLATDAAILKGGVAKVAQLLGYAAAPDDPDARAALAALWDSAPPMSAADARQVVTEDLGEPEEVFSSWDSEPFASASIGQVHGATGEGEDTDYAVKVQYPDIAKALREDLESKGLAKQLAGADMDRGIDDNAVEAIRKAVLRELDYGAEAEALSIFRRRFRTDKEVIVPRVHKDLSSPRVLTMERIHGRPLVQVIAEGTEELCDAVGTIIFRFAWRGPLRYGIVQADPNPGNYLVLEDPIRVAFLDYGCSIELDEDARRADLSVWKALLYHDPIMGAERFRYALHQTGMIPNLRSFHTDLCREWEQHVAAPFLDTQFTWTQEYAEDLAAYTAGMIRTGKLRLPAKLVLLWRQRMGTAAVLGNLEPTANFRGILRTIIAECD
jgi:predicted unusual protein kinase regulating ubiquinone biosynthesis (AarF/ABC1/UbiB family)